MLSVVAWRGRNFYNQPTEFFYTRWLIFCNLPAEFLQPATRIFTTSQPNVYNLPPFCFFAAALLVFDFTNADVFYLARCTHNVSVTHGKPWPSQATPRPRVDCYCHDWPAKQPRDRGLIVTIGQPSKPATAV